MKKKLEIVQVFRAYGCILILTYHLPYDNIFKSNHSGFVLSMFFVISGYFLVIGSFKDTKFYFRKKIIRIVPLYWTLTMLLYIFQCIRPGFVSEISYTIPMVIKSLLFIPYSYDGLNMFPILPVGWTLVIEFYVYIIFYLSIRTVQFFNKKKISNNYHSIIIFAFIIIIGTIVVKNLRLQNAYAMVVNSKYLFSFLGGMCIAALNESGVLKKYKIKLKKAGLLFAYPCFIFAFVFDSYVYEFMPIAFSTIVFLIAILLSDNCIDSKMAKIGDVSFSFYLIHKFIIAIVSKIISLFNLNIIPLSIIIVLVSIVFSLILSWLLNIIFEKKISNILYNKFCRS